MSQAWSSGHTSEGEQPEWCRNAGRARARSGVVLPAPWWLIGPPQSVAACGQPFSSPLSF